MTQNNSRYPDEQNLKDHYGWVIPDFYSDPKTEFLAAQNDAVVHDSSYVGRLKATGPDTLYFLNRMSTNQVINLDQGRCVPTILTTDRGRILDLIHVIKFILIFFHLCTQYLGHSCKATLIVNEIHNL